VRAGEVLHLAGQSISDGAKHLLDALSVGALVAALFSWLPQIAALLTVVWFALRIAIGLQEYKLNGRKLRARE
jgi:hypothetical protein